MNLRGIDFKTAWNASGAMNFFGEGWPYHRPLRAIGLRFDGSTFVAKTTTVEPRAGNMPLDGTRPREWKPRCIAVNLPRAAVLNAVGLSGPGLDALLADGRWQARTEPFLLSFMAVEGDPAKRLDKAREFSRILAPALPRFRAPIGLELNFSCPNVGIDPSGLIAEARETLSEVAAALPGVPLVPKFNAMVPVQAAREIAAHKDCAAVCVSNTIPWGKLPDRIDWKGLFGDASPLAEFGGGGLSGAPIFPIVKGWFAEASRAPFPVPLVAGGGITRPSDARDVIALGASFVEIGSAAMVRPWRVSRIIAAALAPARVPSRSPEPSCA